MDRRLFLFVLALFFVAKALPSMGQTTMLYETQINSFKLYDAVSMAKYAFQIDKQRNRTKDNPEDWEDIIFTNRDHSSHLRLIHHPGDAQYEMAGLEVRQGLPDPDEDYHTSLPDKVFMTPNGVMLGLKEHELREIHGQPSHVRQEGDYKVLYYADENTDSWFLKQYNQEGYIMEYWFLNGVLTRFSFGFVYP